MSGEKERIGRYEVIGELGRGGMGVVYKARDPVIDRTVAIKVINLEGFTKPQAEEIKERFRREAQIAGKIQNQHIVTVYDVGEHNGNSFIAMEYVEGVTLDKHLEARQYLEADEASRIVNEISMGLKSAHKLGIIHRDIKPSNIILSNDGPAKLMDFGIAHVEDSTLTGKGTYLGSPSFMSPEQVLGRELDPRSDIFSLGILLYILLTGEKPFPGENFNTISYRILREEPSLPSSLNVLIPKGYDYIVSKLLAKELTARYNDVGEVITDLGRVEELETAQPVRTLVKPASPAPAEETTIIDEKYSTDPPKLPLLLMGIVMALLLVGGVLFMFLKDLGNKPVKNPAKKTSVSIVPTDKPPVETNTLLSATPEVGKSDGKNIKGGEPETPEIKPELVATAEKDIKKTSTHKRAKKRTSTTTKKNTKKKRLKSPGFIKKIKKKLKRDK